MEGDNRNLNSENEGEKLNRKKSLSRSESDESEEWVLVNNLGSEVENSGCQVYSNEVGVAATFDGSVFAKKEAAAAIAIETKLVEDAELNTEVKPDVQEKIKIGNSDEPDSKIEPKTELEDGPKSTEASKENGGLSDLDTCVEISSSTESVMSVSVVEDHDAKDIAETPNSNGSELLSHLEEKTVSASSDESSRESSQICFLDRSIDDISPSRASTAVIEDPIHENENAVGSLEQNLDDSLESETCDSASDSDESNEESEPEPERPLAVAPPPLIPNVHIRPHIPMVPADRLHRIFMLSALCAALIGINVGIIVRDMTAKRELQDQFGRIHLQLKSCFDNLTNFEDGFQENCKEGYCAKIEKPSCLSDVDDQLDIKIRIEKCMQQLASCQAQYKVMEEDKKKRGGMSMMRTFRDLRLLREQLDEVQKNYFQLFQLFLDKKKFLNDASTSSNGDIDAKPGNENPKSGGNVGDNSMKTDENRDAEYNLNEQENDLRKMLLKSESMIEKLNMELAKIKKQKKNGNAGDSDDDDEGPEFHWNKFTNLLKELKDSIKFDEIFESSVDAIKNSKISGIVMDQIENLPSTVNDIASNLKQNFDEQLENMEEKFNAIEWDEYMNKAKDVTYRVGETVGNLWQQAVDLSENLYEQHGDKGEKILDDIKSAVGKAAEVFDQQWEQATRFWRDIVKPKEFDIDLEDEPVSDAGPEVETEPETETESNYDYSFEHTPEANEHENTEIEGEFNAGTSADEIHDNDDEEMKLKFKITTSFINEMRQLREILKSSPAFARFIGEEFADHYFRRLKQASKIAIHDDGHSDESVIGWWICQKLWWTRHLSGFGRQCSGDKLMSWQRHKLRTTDPGDLGQKLSNEIPELKNLIKKFGQMNEQNSEADKIDGNWLFEWAKNRREIRREEEELKMKNADKDSWLYKRWKNRDEIRLNQQNFDENNFNLKSKWLFRRGKERERERKNQRDENGEHQNYYWQQQERRRVQYSRLPKGSAKYGNRNRG